MQVDSSAIASRATHVAAESREVSERLEVRGVPSASSAGAAAEPGDSISYIDSKTLLAAFIYEFFTGRKARFIQVAHLKGGPQSAQANSSWGVSYSRQEVHRDVENTTFAAEGTVRLKSGVTVSFSLELTMNREETEVNGVSFRAGNMSDPIVVNLDGQGARLSSERTQFDLDSDGMNESIATLVSGSAWLAQDANGNGTIDNGTELFGPRSGNGFAELARLDSDHNGWIDEGDAPYGRMGLWQDGHFTSLRDAGIGALDTSSLATPFALKDGSELLGQVRRSAVYLTEEGQAGVLQQLDLKI